MMKNLQSLGLILLMLVVGSGMKVSAELIVLEWNVQDGDEKKISLVTNSADAQIEVCWNWVNADSQYESGATTMQHSYTSINGVITARIRVTNANILELNCSGQDITSIYLAGMPMATKFDLSNNSLKEPMGLTENTELLYLDYSGNLLGESSVVGDKPSVLDLSKNTKLKELNISNNGLNDARIPELNANEALEVLNMSNNDFVSPADLSGNENLKELDYSNNEKLTLLNVQDLTSLEKVNVSGNAALVDLYLDNCSSLNSLDISGTTVLDNISTEGIADGQITDFSSEGTGLGDDLLTELQDKVYVPAVYSVALNVAAGVDLADYTSGTLQIEENTHLFLQFLSENEGAEVVLLIDGEEIDYTKNANGYSTYILNPIEKDYTIELYLNVYNVTFPAVEGFTFEGEATAEYGKSYTFSVTLDDAIDAGAVSVLVNNEKVEPQALRAAAYTVTIDKVTGPIVVGVEYATVGIQPIKSGKVYTLDGTLVVETTATQAVQVYNLTGKKAFSRTVNGSESIALTPGVYIVRVGDEVQKIVVR